MLKLKLKNCVHGKGVFAVNKINAGELILQFNGPVILADKLPFPYCAENDYYLQIGPEIFLGPSDDLDDFVNHSCDPNCGVIISSRTTSLIAITPISPGSEITFDYSTTMDNFWWEMDCACGSENCRQKIKNFVDLDAEIKERYVQLGIVPDYILQKLTKCYILNPPDPSCKTEPIPFLGRMIFEKMSFHRNNNRISS